MSRDIKQAIWAILLVSVGGLIGGVILMVGGIRAIASEAGSERMTLALITFVVSSVGVQIGFVLKIQQTRLERVEAELARLKSDPFAPRPW